MGLQNDVYNHSFRQMRNYMSIDVQRKLDDELQAVERAVDQELDKFAKELADYTAQKTAEVETAMQADMESKMASLMELVTALDDIDISMLKEHSDSLKAELETFRQQWTGYGQKFRGAVLTGLRASGIPLG